MSFPNLTRTPAGVLHSTATGIPVNGNNSFDAGIDLEQYDKQIGVAKVNDWLVIRIFALGTSVLGSSFVERIGNLITVNFQQSGVDQAFVELELIHSIPR